MPIYELGYRHWEGPLCGPLLRAWAITRTGIALAFRSMILRRLLLMAWMPLLYLGPVFFLVGYLTDPSRAVALFGSGGMVKAVLGSEIANRLLNDPASVRPAAWALAFYLSYSYFQSFLTLVVVAIVAPPLIAQDIQTKAFLIYFSKPITRLEYLLGKLGVVLFYIFLVTLLPSLALYAVSIAFSPTIAVLLQTGMTLVHVTLAAGLVAIPAAVIALFFSSLTSDARYATFGWMTLWVLGDVVYWLLMSLTGLQHSKVVFLLSIRETTVVVIRQIFDVTGKLRALGDSPEMQQFIAELDRPYSPGLALAVLVVLTAVSLAGLWWRIAAPTRI